jgi:hypothetical protein
MAALLAGDVDLIEQPVLASLDQLSLHISPSR